MNAKIILCPGDGIGPEVTHEARRILEAIAFRFDHRFTFEEHAIGGVAIEACGDPLPDATLAACAASEAVLLGAVGGPRWDDPQAKVRPEQGLLGLRAGLGLWANLRPVVPYPCLRDRSSLRPDRLVDVDLLVIRELTGGLYFGQPRGRDHSVAGGRRAVDTLVYTEHEITRVVDLAFRLAAGRRRKVTSIDKANVLESSRLWREIATEIGERNPRVRLEHMLVDTAAMRLVTQPSQFDVIVTENMFGDILTDEAAVLAGTIGLLPSASLGDGPRGMYEPIHGSAPDIAGHSIANPVGAILSAAMLCRYSLGLEPEAAAIERAVETALADGARTADLGGTLTTQRMGAVIRDRIEDLPGVGATA